MLKKEELREYVRENLGSAVALLNKSLQGGGVG